MLTEVEGHCQQQGYFPHRPSRLGTSLTTLASG